MRLTLAARAESYSIDAIELQATQARNLELSWIDRENAVLRVTSSCVILIARNAPVVTDRQILSIALLVLPTGEELSRTVSCDSPNCQQVSRMVAREKS